VRVPTPFREGGEGEARRKQAKDGQGAALIGEVEVAATLGLNIGEEATLRRLSSDNGSPKGGSALRALV
jgi:hypothetical protein